MQGHLFSTVSYGIGFLVSVGLLVATIIVVSRLGRRYRPASSGLLVGWSVAALVWDFARHVLVSGTQLLLARVGGGIDTYLDAQAATSLLSSIVSIALGVVFLVGLARVMRDESGTMPPRLR